MKYGLVSLIAIFAMLPVRAQPEAASGINKMHVVVGVISVQKDEKEVFETLMDYHIAASKDASALMSYWWDLAQTDCDPFLRAILTAELAKSKNGELSSAAWARLDRKNNMCLEAYIFDRWDEVVVSINNGYAPHKK